MSFLNFFRKNYDNFHEKISANYIIDFRGRFISYDINTKKVISTFESNENLHRCILIQCKKRPDVAFILTKKKSFEISFAGDNALPRPVMSYHLLRAGTEDEIALRHPLWDHYVCSPHDNSDAPISCNRPHISRWEKFRFHPIENMDEIQSSYVKSISEFVSNDISAKSLSRWLESATNYEKHALLPAFLRLLSRDEMQNFGEILLKNSVTLAALKTSIQDDYWIRESIPQLVEWNKKRYHINSLKLDGSTDFFGELDYGHSRPPPLGYALWSQMRRLIKSRKQSCILATARDEGIYLLEWIAWHRAIGFDHIFICSNSNMDRSDELLQALSANGIITWVDTNPESPIQIQRKAYGAAMANLPQMLDYQWTLVIDLDEFLALDFNFYTEIRTFFDLQDARGADGIAFSWVMMTPDGKTSHDAQPMISRFQRREPPQNLLVKTAFQTRLASFCHAHNPHWAFQRSHRTFDTDGKILHTELSKAPHLSELGEKNAWIAHYFHKSLEEYVWKHSRPRGDTKNFSMKKSYEIRFIQPFIDFFDKNNTLPDKRLEPFIPALKKEISFLRSIPDIKKAEDRVKDYFAQNIEALVKETASIVQNSKEPLRIKQAWAALLETYQKERQPQ
ncbi:glycosyltransferase family 2 protein [Brytella acorum]|uniref:Glycosyltransferase family 2 protein n=1 Tax=Brytella acorum TaxID=2959299 RepID=A0AA35UXP6_9PROT|nr:glycosyltransferase family 2 protein [Brytella acorum]MDF3623483.1 glycosyltransferase family 2 protein [Brytella acorum]CAI9121384.1 glycosyltransferase family 2 protein [Brytella acorum]